MMAARRRGSFRECWVDIPWYAVLALTFLLPISPALSNTAIVVGIVAWLVRGIVQRNLAIRSMKMGGLFVLWGLSALLSMTNSVDLLASAHGILKIVKAFSVFLLASEEVRTEDRLRRLLIAALLGASLASLDGLLQWVIGVDPIYRQPLGSPLEGLRRVSGPYHHSNAFGIFLTCLLPVVVATVHAGRAWRLRALGWVALPLVATALILTFSRGALVGAGVALLVFFVVRRAWSWLAGSVVVGLLVVLCLPQPIQAWIRHQPNLFAVLVQSEAPSTSRPNQWRTAIRMLLDHPWVGVGVNTFVLNYDRYRGPDEGETNRPYAHNQYLQMLAARGLIGFSVFLLMLRALFQRWGQAARMLKEPVRTVALGIGFGLLAFLINGLDESALQYSRLAPVFWLWYGMLFAVPFSARDA